MFLLGFLPGAAASTTTQTSGPVADTYVSQSSPNSNYGGSTSLKIDNSPVIRSYLRFNLQGLSGTVSQATLRLYTRSSSSRGYSVHGVADNTWGEKTITHANAPAASQTVSGSSGSFSSGRWLSIDVTSLVSANGPVSFALTTTSSSSVTLASREYGASFAPQLVVTTTSFPPTNGSPPAISGVPQEGQSLAATPGAWTGTDPIGYAYQWHRCDSGGAGCADIAGATASIYTLTAADRGATMRVTVTASNSAGSSTATSAETEIVNAAAPAVAPLSLSPPITSGTAQEGQTLAATPGTWTGTDPIGYAYQWHRCDSGGAGCADIAGATGTTYTLTAADVGTTIRVAVTASNSAGASTATSVETEVVPALPPTNSSPPIISGVSQKGQTLTAGPGTWTGTDPIGYAYQWRRCDSAGAGCADIAGATGTTYTLTAPDVGTTIRVTITASNSAGSSTATSVGTAPVSPPGDPVIAAAGDIACDPASSSFNGGLGTSTSCRQKHTSDLLVGSDLAGVLTLGDNQYEDGALAKFQASYDASWGRVKSITRPSAGNHEYSTADATGHFDYFNGTGNPTGPAGERGKGYYSFDIGSWHLIALNSNCSRVGGCGVGSPQEQWLKSDLTAHPNSCTLAYWHHARFSSGPHGNHASMQPIWQALYDASADVVLGGHDHAYERFAPQDPDGALDLSRGIRQFVVGSGGKSHYSFTTTQPNSEARNSDTFGVLKLTLHPTGYEWRFAAEAGKTFTDSGSDDCQGTATDSLAPTAPTNLTATAVGSSRADLNWNPASDNVGVTAYEVYRNGSLLATTAAATTTYSDNDVAGASTYSYHVKARDAAGNLSTASNTATVTTPANATALTLSAEADARVQEANPGTNYGTSYLRTDGGSDLDVESYLRFNVSGLSGTVVSAKLRVYAYTGTANGPAVYGTSSDWSETGITWSNRPVRSGAATDDKGSIATNSWVEYDVRPFIVGNGTYSFVLATSSSDGVDIHSREAASLRPELIVVFG
jgi:hypothetical protein